MSFAFSQLEMVQALLAPYENRSWAQTNWILVRLWKVWKPFNGTVECISIPRSVIRFRNNLIVVFSRIKIVLKMEVHHISDIQSCSVLGTFCAHCQYLNGIEINTETVLLFKITTRILSHISPSYRDAVLPSVTNIYHTSCQPRASNKK